MADIYFSSDPHLAHANILKFTKPCRSCEGKGRTPGNRKCVKCGGLGQVRVRPFNDLGEMHAAIIDRHNARVRPQDHWYCLGDLTMQRQLGQIDSILTRLNGHKRIILGNHDMAPIKDYVKYFEKVTSYRVIDNIMFSHIPIHPDSMGRFAGNVHGHIHSNRGDTPFDTYPPIIRGEGPARPYLNLSMEVIDYTPVSLEEVQAYLKKAAKLAPAIAKIKSEFQ